MIVLRELKETRFRLRVLRRSGYLIADQDLVIAESDELVEIVATVIRNTRPPRRRVLTMTGAQCTLEWPME